MSPLLGRARGLLFALLVIVLVGITRSLRALVGSGFFLGVGVFAVHEFVPCGLEESFVFGVTGSGGGFRSRFGA